MKNDKTKKWFDFFQKKGSRPLAGAYTPQKLGTVQGLFLITTGEQELLDQNMYQIDALTHGGLEVHLVTDSLEILKVLSNRAFPRTRLAHAIH
ncbi:MAG: hypothetical protein JWN50_165, partial [Parcubacteria group bacterium]|nr:hypothetical protein [Parcubacteria group bacterium]